MAELQKHWEDGAVLLWKVYTFLLRSARVEIFPGLYNFADAYANHRGHIYHLHVACRHASV